MAALSEPNKPRYNLSICKDLLDRDKWTPDLAQLRYSPHHLLFIYDDFKMGGDYNHILKGEAQYLGRARTATSTYSMKVGDGPVMFMHADKNSHHALGYARGELYAVTTQLIQALDLNLYNGIMFSRVSRSVLALDQGLPNLVSVRPQRPYQKAFMYIGEPEFWNDLSMVHLSRSATSDKPNDWSYSYDVNSKKMKPSNRPSENSEIAKQIQEQMRWGDEDWGAYGIY